MNECWARRNASGVRGLARPLVAVIAPLLLIALSCGPVSAAPPGPQTPATPVQVPAALEVQSQNELAPSLSKPLALPPLKAVLIVGPIDGDYGDWTNAEKANMELAAAELAAHGVTIYRFYAPQNDWNQIQAAAQGAHFLLYRGHGVYWSDMPSPIVGGFALKDTFVSADMIRASLHLATNAVVMLYACFSAGTAGNDAGSITSQEARRRVAMYSHPFLDIGAAGYYADWFGDAFEKYVRYLFDGQTLGQAYESFYDFNPATVERYVHPDHPDQVMWLDKDFWDGKTQYNDAFVGWPGWRLTDLFRVITMEVAPASVTYVAQPADASRSFTLAVRGQEGAALHWRATLVAASPGWATLEAASGDSSQPVRLTLTPGRRATGVYTAELLIVSDTPDVQNPSSTVPIKMQLVSQLRTVRFPLVSK